MRVYDRGNISNQSSYNVLHALKGYKNKNWPIRSCFFKFRNGGLPLNGRASSSEDIFEPLSNPDKLVEAHSLLATGSADPFVYVYSLMEVTDYV